MIFSGLCPPALIYLIYSVVQIGIDIIKDYDYLKPNKQLAKKIINYMRENGILLSTDGPYDNVIKIKPPLLFNRDYVDNVCKNLEIFFKKI